MIFSKCRPSIANSTATGSAFIFVKKVFRISFQYKNLDFDITPIPHMLLKNALSPVFDNLLLAFGS